MNNEKPNIFQILAQSFLFAILFSFSFSVFAQQSVYFKKPENLSECNEANEIQKRILYEYGAVYVSEGAILPKKCRFENETEIAEFINQFKSKETKFGFGEFYLQPNAKKSLDRVIEALGNDYKRVARNDNNSTTTTNGINDDWALRTYAQTQVNWGGKYKDPIFPIIMSEPKSGNFKDKPKMFSVAIPGGSQHHLGLAIDVNPEGSVNACADACEKALKANGWFRTVRYDAYHFTYLGQGLSEQDLRNKGLKNVTCRDGKKYWVPNVENYGSYKYWGCE